MHKRVTTSSIDWTGGYYVGDMRIRLVIDGRETEDEREWLSSVQPLLYN